MKDAEKSSSKPSAPEPQRRQVGPSEVAEEDFYFDGPYLVFTAAYHRKRGFCCNSGCRHCPYREE